MNAQQATAITWTGRRLAIARAVGVALAITYMAAFAASVVPGFEQLRVPCSGDECGLLGLSSIEAAELEDIGLSMDFYAGVQAGVSILGVALHTLLAGVIFWRRSGDPVAIFVSVTLVVLGTFVFSTSSLTLVEEYPGLAPLVNVLLAVATISLLLLFYLVPDGRFVPGWTRLVTVVMAGSLLIASPFSPDMIFYTPGWVSAALYAVMLGCVGTGVFAQVYRYRRVSGPVQRQQTKIVVLGFGAMGLLLLTWSLVFELFPLSHGTARLYLNLIGGSLGYVMAILFPLSLAVAILRYRLWDIDVLINRALVYGLLSAMLGAVYLGSVVVLQAGFRTVTGQGSTLALVVSTLAIAALFQPLRRKVQGVIDRRFYRRRYDAARTLASFGAVARNEVDIERLSDALVAAVSETVQPAHASLWLRDAAAERQR